MGLHPPFHTAHPWMYFVPYQRDVNAALQELRQQEFEAGRWFDGTGEPPEADSIEDALDMMLEVGTRSILDMVGVSARRQVAYAAPLSEQYLGKIFGTTRPTHEQVERDGGLVRGGGIFDRMQRGIGVYFTVYKDDRPDELCFAGYSYE